MARAVRFTKPEREVIRDTLRDFIKGGPMKASWAKAAQSALDKLESAEHPEPEKTRNYLSTQEAIAAFQGVLGRRLILPPNGASLEYAKMQQRLKSLGLTREQCAQIADEAGRSWKGSIKVQSLINQAERLLHDAEDAPPQTGFDNNHYGMPPVPGDEMGL